MQPVPQLLTGAGWGALNRSAPYSWYSLFGKKWVAPDESSYTILVWFTDQTLERNVWSRDITFYRSDRSQASLNVDCIE